jgi:hypothetical protein
MGSGSRKKECRGHPDRRGEEDERRKGGLSELIHSESTTSQKTLYVRDSRRRRGGVGWGDEPSCQTLQKDPSAF